jgi:hypothetical protein
MCHELGIGPAHINKGLMDILIVGDGLQLVGRIKHVEWVSA